LTIEVDRRARAQHGRDGYINWAESNLCNVGLPFLFTSILPHSTPRTSPTSPTSNAYSSNSSPKMKFSIAIAALVVAFTGSVSAVPTPEASLAKRAPNCNAAGFKLSVPSGYAVLPGYDNNAADVSYPQILPLRLRTLGLSVLRLHLNIDPCQHRPRKRHCRLHHSVQLCRRVSLQKVWALLFTIRLRQLSNACRCTNTVYSPAGDNWGFCYPKNYR
jgi:hypothetical protein